MAIPEEQDELRAWMADFEAREYAFTPEAAQVARAVGEDCVQRYFPGPARSLGWGILRAMCDDRLLDAVGQPPATVSMRRLTAAATRAYIAGRRSVPGPACDRLVAPWTTEYGPDPSPAEVGAAWAAGITAGCRRYKGAGRPDAT